MGGHALKTVRRRGRMSKEEYDTVKKAVVARLSTFYAEVRVPPEDPGKEDYGDVDVVCLRAGDDNITAGQTPGTPPLEALLGTEEIVRNGRLISFAFRGRQIDLTEVSSVQALHFQLVFNSYGGVVASVLGTCFCKPRRLLMNSERLAVILPFLNNHQKLVLTYDVWEALRFFGLAAQPWQEGFSDRTSIYRWLSTSRFFEAADIVPGILGRSSHPRPILHEFVAFCQDLHLRNMDRVRIHPCTPPEAVLSEILTFFNKTDEYASKAAKHHPLIP